MKGFSAPWEDGGGTSIDGPAPSKSRTDQIAMMEITALKPRARNPRTHSQKQIEQIAASITRFGFINPVLIDEENRIIAGHGRVAGAKRAGLKQVPTLRVSHLTETEIRAYVIADNKLAENAGWDRDLLALELQELSIELNFDISLTGFETPEIDNLLRDLAGEPAESEAEKVDKTCPPVSRPGDLWHIGSHRLLCGDARDRESFRRLMQAELAGCVFTDPPYNVAIDGHVSGLGQAHHREFAMASGEMSRPEFTDFLKGVFANIAASSRHGSIHFICMDWRHLLELSDAAHPSYGRPKNLCVWVKTNAGMGSLYRSQHELVFVFKKGVAPHINNVELGKHGRNRSNVWSYPGMNSFGANRAEELSMHPTVKPLAMVIDAILDVSDRNDIVLDPFSGSGTTILAADACNRRGYGMEIDPHYVDLIISRCREAFGAVAVHATTGDTWEVTKNKRHV